MSNDLISRKALINALFVRNGKMCPDTDVDNFPITINVKDVKKAIRNAPTAYDMDKVIEQINNLDIKAIPRYKGGTFGDYEGTDYYIKKSDVLEILKAVLMQ